MIQPLFVPSETLTYDRDEIARRFDLEVEKLSDPAPPNGLKLLIENEAIKQLKLSGSDTLLDLGCGVGRVALGASLSCRWVYGVDVSRKSIEIAKKGAASDKRRNILFSHGAIEEPSLELDLAAAEPNKMLLLASLRYLPDDLKIDSLRNLARILRRPGRIVIGDLIFFEPAESYRAIWKRIGYDGGQFDRPASAAFLERTLSGMGAKITTVRLHPLGGVIVGEWR